MNTTGAVPGGRRVVRQTVWITAVAVLAYFGIRNLPVDSGGLHYNDFGAGQGGMLEFCEPGGPQFVPVDRVRSPVTMEIRLEQSGGAMRVGETGRLTVRLTASSGKPVTDADLLVVHTRKLHLLLVDPSLDDYQHLHPEITSVPGEYSVDFTPRRPGEYRAFADFTPRATGRALYAGARLSVAPSRSGGAHDADESPQMAAASSGITDEADPAAQPLAIRSGGAHDAEFDSRLASIRSGGGNDAGINSPPTIASPVASASSPSETIGKTPRPAQLPPDVGSDKPVTSASGQAAAIDETRTSVVDGYQFVLSLDRDPPRINEISELRLEVLGADGSPAQLEEIMGAHAHVVAFDRARTGFAHLHPIADPSIGADHRLRFQLHLTDPGTYRLWAQVKITGRELFAPFTVTVRP